MAKKSPRVVDFHQSPPANQPYRRLIIRLIPHLTFHTTEATRRLDVATPERCFEILEGHETLVKSADPRLQ